MNDENAIGLEAQLDLLAEGELSDDARERLFARLDRSPQLWRECAFVLMETGALKSSFEVIGPPTSRTAIAGPPSSKGTRSGRSWKQLWPAALAATLLLLIGGALGRMTSPPGPLAAGSNNDAVLYSAQLDPGHSTGVHDAVARLNLRDVQLLAVISFETGTSRQWVPVVHSDKLQDQVLADDQIELSPDYIQWANEMGWHVVRQRRLLAIEQPAQDTTIIPLETLSYQFVGNEPF